MSAKKELNKRRNHAAENRASLAFGIVIAVMLAITAIKPQAQPVQLATTSDIDMTPSKGAKALGGVVIILTIALYIVLW